MISSKRIYIAVFFIIMLAFLGLRFLLYPNRLIPEENIVSDIEKQINKTFNNNKVNFENFDARIELFEDVINKRFVVYSFFNPQVGHRHTGYAVYEISQSNKYKRIGFGWNSSSFNVQHLNFSSNSDSKTYLMVFGMNGPNEKQTYEYSSGKEKKIVEFSGDYFLKKYLSNGNPIGFKNIN